MRVLVRLLAAGLCAAAAASAVQAQTRVQAQGSAGARPASSLPNPAGLRPVFPAGISSGSGAAQSTDPIARSNAPVPPGSVVAGAPVTGGTVFVPQVLPSGVVTEPVQATNVMGAGATVAGPSQYLNSGAGGVSAADEARSFFFADANHDGELSRSEFGRLSIVTQSFEQMDRNFDGVISRFEYQDSLR